MVAELKPSPAERVLVLTRVFDAPRSLVFSVWTKPEHLVRWFGPNDFSLPHCTQDFRPGGSYRFCMRGPDGTDYWVWGDYREVVPPELLVFTWNRQDADGNPLSETVVTVTFVEHAAGKTTLTLRHAGFETDADRDAHNGGWSQCLDRLVAYAETVSAL